jgi:dTDP-4-dehydrorhamnose reductase
VAVANDKHALVTGAGGQLGRALVANPPPGWRVTALERGACDITDPAAVTAQLAASGAALLINAAAYTAVDRAEEDVEQAMAANARAPGVLAGACAALNVRLLHVSTDFVFDGCSSTPYTVDAATGPLGVYGRSKLAGEEAVREACADSVIMRTGWVYSHTGHNFLLTMLRLHRERDELAVVADQVGTPTAASSLAGALWATAGRPDLSGTFHWSDAGVCSWYDFAVAIGEEAVALGLIERAATVRPIATADYPTAARRPAYSVLDKSASWDALGLPPQHWRAALRDTLQILRGVADG